MTEEQARTHYGSHGMAECGAHGDGRVAEALLTTDPALVTCSTCRGWLPIVVWPKATTEEPRTLREQLERTANGFESHGSHHSLRAAAEVREVIKILERLTAPAEGVAQPAHVHSRACYDDPGPAHGHPSLICGFPREPAEGVAHSYSRTEFERDRMGETGDRLASEPLCRCPANVCLLHPSQTTCGMRTRTEEIKERGRQEWLAKTCRRCSHPVHQHIWGALGACAQCGCTNHDDEAEGVAPLPQEQETGALTLVDESVGGAGVIAFDVDMGLRQVVSVSLTTEGLGYTLLLGNVSDHGYLQFDKPLPSILIDWLREQAKKFKTEAS